MSDQKHLPQWTVHQWWRKLQVHLHAWIPAGHQRTHVHRCGFSVSCVNSAPSFKRLFWPDFLVLLKGGWLSRVSCSVMWVQAHKPKKKKNPPKSLGKIPQYPSRPAGNVDIQRPACSEVGAAKLVQCKVKRHVVSCWHWNICVTIGTIRPRLLFVKK